MEMPSKNKLADTNLALENGRRAEYGIFRMSPNNSGKFLPAITQI